MIPQLAPAAESLESLYRRLGPAVYRRAFSLLRDDAEAVDVTQEAFLAYWRMIPRPDAQPFTVLYQVVTYRAVDLLRKRSRWTGALHLTERCAEPDEESSETDLRRVEAAQDLALLTRGEKPAVLTVALLCLVEGYTQEEAAATLDLSRKTVARMLTQFLERAHKRSARMVAR